MQQRLLTTVAAGSLLMASWAVSASACDQHGAKSTNAAASVKTADYTTAEKSHSCTAEQIAACKAKASAANVAHSCAGKAGKVSAAAAANHCGAKATAAKAAAASAKATSAEYDAYPAGGAACKGRGMTTTADAYSHLGCDACADMAACESELKSTGSVTQILKLKNGVMFVHTAVGPSRVSALQAAMVRRNERLNAMTTAGYNAKLCPECKAMRGAIASGKLNRETVTIEGGCLTLMTSNDRAMISKLHAMAVDHQSASRIKS